MPMQYLDRQREKLHLIRPGVSDFIKSYSNTSILCCQSFIIFLLINKLICSVFSPLPGILKPSNYATVSEKNAKICLSESPVIFRMYSR